MGNGQIIEQNYFGFTIYQYKGSNGTGFSVNWCDIVSDDQGEQKDISDKDLPF